MKVERIVLCMATEMKAWRSLYIDLSSIFQLPLILGAQPFGPPSRVRLAVPNFEPPARSSRLGNETVEFLNKTGVDCSLEGLRKIRIFPVQCLVSSCISIVETNRAGMTLEIVARMDSLLSV